MFLYLEQENSQVFECCVIICLQTILDIIERSRVSTGIHVNVLVHIRNRLWPPVTPCPPTPPVARRPLFLHHPMIQSVHCYRDPTLWIPFTLHISDGNYSRIHGKLDLKLIYATFLLLISFHNHLKPWRNNTSVANSDRIANLHWIQD